MIEQLQIGYTGLKTALEIAQGIQALKTETAVNQAVIDIQRHVVEAQKSLTEADTIHSADLKRIDALEQEIVSLKDWSAEQENYELADAGNEVLAYRIKSSVETSEPPHWLCPNCYQNRKKSILQPDRQTVGRAKHLICHACSLNVIVEGRRQDSPKVISGATSWGRGR
ncbi:hypothetical protein [Parasphingorhabdus flavimaris]|uniref:hypothetical protein n=1 Tax=Parasphingorhabdus flavimaris TaxID=266812 RepID=UPI0030016DAF